METEKGEKKVFFLEAKRSTYLESAMKRGNRRKKGFNSSINGQIELNYRFSRALLNRKPGEIKESSEVFAAYGENKARILKNPFTIEKVVQKMECKDNMDFYHLILTSDDSNPFISGDTDDYFPGFFNENGVNLYEEMKSNICWVGYENLLSVSNDDGYFSRNYGFNNRSIKTHATDQEMVKIDGKVHGVLIVFVPEYSENLLHLSWRGNSSVLRDYVSLLEGPEKIPVSTEYLEGKIKQYRKAPARRKPYTNREYWYKHLMNKKTRKGMKTYNCSSRNP
ncbi:MAG: hypothetical protein ACYS8W_00495 [Planctomycetota bacterium]